MNSCSTDNPVVRAAFILLMLALACNAFAFDSRTPEQALQGLGAQVKLASDQADAGRLPTPATMANLEHALAGFRETAAEDSAFGRKLQAITLLFGKLKYQTAHPQSAPARPAVALAQMDMEVLSATHGATCATAFGISEALPVKVALTQSGKAGSDAWFRFEAAAAGHFRFKTDSSGADPAIEIFRDGCAANAISIAANDDNFGLDATTSVAAADRTGLVIHVTNSGTAGQVELSVQAISATITGRITDAATGLPISGTQVGVFSSNGNYLFASAYTDQRGDYSLSVSPNTYYVRASNSQYVAELYPNAQCGYSNNYYDLSACPIAQAQTVTVADAATVSNIDIALNKGNRISGVVRDSSSQPVSSASVYIYDGTGSQLGGTNTDGFGRYSFSDLPVGSYKLVAQANGYGSQIWNEIACSGPFQTQCDDLSHASIVDIWNQDVGGVSFSLPVLATIQGNLNGPGLQSVSNVYVVVLDSVGNFAAQAYADSSGHYRAGPLPIGNYYVYATAAGYFSQIFNGIDCAQDCTSSIPAATAIAITQTEQVGVADFKLTPLPVVHGHIQDAVSGLPLANVTVAASIYPPASFSTLSWTTTDSSGNYSLTGTPAGQYYLWAQSNDHVDQIYSGIACEAPPNYYPQNPSCDVSGATQLVVSPGQTPATFDFALQTSSSISGKAIIRAGSGSDLPAAYVQISAYNGAGVIVSSANTDSLGRYVVNDLPAGTYFLSAATNNYNQYVTQVWQLIDCPNNCAVTAGTPVVAGQGALVPGIDFLLTLRDAVVGRVTDTLGAPIGGVLIDLFDASNNNYRATGVSDPQGFYAAAWNAGFSYYVATEVNGRFVDQVYAGVSCPLGPAFFGLCPFTNAMAVPLTNGSAQPHIVNFVLQSNDPIFRNGFQ